jgi:hypothetical protein
LILRGGRQARIHGYGAALGLWQYDPVHATPQGCVRHTRRLSRSHDQEDFPRQAAVACSGDYASDEQRARCIPKELAAYLLRMARWR